MHVLITGASSGIGLALAQHWAPRADTLIAVSRHATGSAALQRLRAQHAGVLCMDADLAQQQKIAALADTLATSAPALTHVINCAGVLHDATLRPEKRLQDVDQAALLHSFQLNAFAPILLARFLLPRISRDSAAVFASLSARVGSISDNHLGGWYAYRAAKAAQNQLLRTLAIETRRSHPNLCVLALHPGTTDTPLSKPFQRNVPADKLFSPERAAMQLAAIIERAGPAEHGRFFAWDGSEIGW